MIYGLYLSAAGVMSSSYRQDVIANNLANSETIAFKRDLPLFHERLTAAQEYHGARNSDPLMEGLGGGLLASPSLVDTTSGDLEDTGNPLDVAIQGSGFFAVDNPGQPDQAHLTRNGRFILDRQGNLVLSDMSGHKVLDVDGKPIQLAPGQQVIVKANGSIVTRDGEEVARLGVFDVPHPEKLAKAGATLLNYPDRKELTASDSIVRGEFIERSNVDPTTEMAELMDAQRQLEANANMIHYQDSTLQLLCNSVGKIS
jgi:flagellar basal-body rod protein FlgF